VSDPVGFIPGSNQYASVIDRCKHGLYIPKNHLEEGRSPFCYGCRAEAQLIIHNFDEMRESAAVRKLTKRRKRNE
jgi:hypothetical protein